MNSNSALTCLQVGLAVRQVGICTETYFKVVNGEIRRFYLTDREWTSILTPWRLIAKHADDRGEEWEVYEPDSSTNLFAPRD